MTRAPVVLAAVLATGIAAACQAQPVGSTCTHSAAPAASAGTGCAPAADPTGDAESGPPGTAASASTVLPNESTATEIDATLLDVLPESIDGVPVAEAPDEAAIALADPTVTRIGSAVDVGLAVDASTGNLVTAHLVRLRDGAFDDATFRQWRDSFDEGACAAADGVQGHAEVPIADRNVFVTSCVLEQRVYHVWLRDQGVLISASEVGSGGFGELLLSGLRTP